MRKALKTLWKHLLFPIVIGVGMLEIVILVAYSFDPIIVFFVFLGVSIAGGVLAMYFTGPRGIWYKPFLACPLTYLPLWIFAEHIIFEDVGLWDAARMSSFAFPGIFLVYCVISLIVGIGFVVYRRSSRIIQIGKSPD